MSLPRLPLWIRLVLAVDRAASATARAASMLRDELLLAWVRPTHRARITDALYAIQDAYAPGGRTFEQGFFEWEAQALEHPSVPRRGRVLVGGAGGGREMAAFRARGYDIVGFDPCEPLVRGAQQRFAADPGVTIVCGSYADLGRTADANRHPLADALAGPPIDLVVLGWGSFSYVATESEAVELMRTIRSLAPTAPVLLSFLRPTLGAPAIAGARARLRRLFARLGAPGRPGTGDAFSPWAGFYRAVAMEEIRTLAGAAGYDVALLREDWYAHALLVPDADARTPHA